MAFFNDIIYNNLMDKYYEKTINSSLIYDGQIMQIKKDCVELSDGYKTIREMLIHNGGVVVVAEKDGKILLVKQYRYPIQRTMFELPAGKLEKGENEFLAAQRELEEETGYKAKSWESLGWIYPSAGYSSEKLFLYYAHDLVKTTEKPDVGEIIDHYFYKIDDVFNMIKNNEICDAKTICALLRAYKL